MGRNNNNTHHCPECGKFASKFEGYYHLDLTPFDENKIYWICSYHVGAVIVFIEDKKENE